MIWYAGIATVLLAAFGAAVLLRRSLRALLTWNDASGARLNWALPVAMLLGGVGGRAVAAVHRAGPAVGQPAAGAGRDPWP